MKINELAKKTGLGIKTIRFYEERGLITPDFEERNSKKEGADAPSFTVLRVSAWSTARVPS